MDSRCPVKARYLIVEYGAFEFAGFLHEQRVQISLALLQTQANIIAEKCSITGFKESRV